MKKQFKILDKVDYPADLRKLSDDKLLILCEDLRNYIIDVVEELGGHFSSPLGVVELSVALHRVFDTPRDLLLWDIGHQAYPHKILTGRRDEFVTLRQENGISGFLKRDESEYDVFGAGHASTGISAAMGMVEARDLKNENNRIVTVIGDGAMTGGLAYEGLNYAGTLKSQFLLVLNDNQMSISPTVGAVSHYLTKVVTNPLYNRIRDKIWNLSGKLPLGRGAVRRFMHSLQEGLKTMVSPGMIFEELGIRYFGPIDGHDLNEMIETFENLKNFNHPAVVHVITKKGTGTKEAENDPLKYYSMGGRNNGQKNKDEAPGYSAVFGKIACELAEQDKDVCCVVAAMREGTGLAEFAKTYPEKFYDGGIAEGHVTTFAAGLAASGLKPIVALYSTFLQRSFDMVIHDIAIQKLPVIFALDRGGVVGPDGPTHHGVFDIAFLQMIPNTIVTAPKDGNELRNLLFTAVNHDLKGPFSVRYPKASSINFDPKGKPKILKIGSWEVLREGKDVAILAVGSIVDEAVKSTDLLKKSGIAPTVVNARFIKPFDETLLAQLMSTHDQIVTVEEGVVTGGFGTTIMNYLNENNYSGKIKIFGIPDDFVEHASRGSLLNQLRLTSSQLAKRIILILSKDETIKEYAEI